VRGLAGEQLVASGAGEIIKGRSGFRFVGTTIIYAYLQAVGVVNDHSRECFLYKSAPR